MVNKELLKTYREEYNTLGLPQTYKHIEFYPITIYEIETRGWLMHLFGRAKDEYIYKELDVRNQKVLYNTSYLKMMITKLQMEYNPDGVEIVNTLREFLRRICRLDDIDDIKILVTKSKGFIKAEELLHSESKIVIEIKGVLFTEKEFNNIREIILEQNGISVDYIESYHPELEDALKLHRETLKASSNITFTDDIFSFSSFMQKPPYELKDYTLYQFKKQYERFKVMEEFRAFFPLEYAGLIKPTKRTPFYNSHINDDKGRYDEILIDMEQFKDNDIFKATQGSKMI